MINIIGGAKKRSDIEVPHTNVRPTSIRKRKSIFSIIESYYMKSNYHAYDKKVILDLFSGSGALGLEAISRGAKFCYFYENDLNVIDYLIKNCKKICNKNFKIINENIIKSDFKNIKDKISIVFIDPPYNTNYFEKILNNLYLSNILTKEAIIILEYSLKLKLIIPPSFSPFNEKIYGKTKISFLKQLF